MWYEILWDELLHWECVVGNSQLPHWYILNYKLFIFLYLLRFINCGFHHIQMMSCAYISLLLFVSFIKICLFMKYFSITAFNWANTNADKNNIASSLIDIDNQPIIHKWKHIVTMCILSRIILFLLHIMSHTDCLLSSFVLCVSVIDKCYRFEARGLCWHQKAQSLLLWHLAS